MVSAKDRGKRGFARRRRMDEDDTPLTDSDFLSATSSDESLEETHIWEDDRLRHSALVVEALKYSWHDLVFHQEQRMVHMRFFLLIIGALIAGFAQAYAAGYVIFALVASLAGCIIGPLFFALDYRDANYSQKAVDAVLPLEKIVAEVLAVPKFMITRRGLLTPAPLRWLRFIFSPVRLLMLIGIMMSFVALMASLKTAQDRLCERGQTSGVPIVNSICKHPVPPEFNTTINKLLPLASIPDGGRRR